MTSERSSAARTEKWERSSSKKVLETNLHTNILHDSASADPKSRSDLQKSFENLDVLVCGKCRSVFHFLEDFRFDLLTILLKHVIAL